MSEFKMLINGQLVDAISGKTMDVVNPANGKFVASVPCAGEEDVDLAVKAAQKAFPAWRKTYVADRVNLVLKLAAKMREHAEELAVLETLHYGGPISKTRVFDANGGPGNLEFVAGLARGLTGHTISANPNARIMTFCEPMGVVGLITPWNFPMCTATSKLGPALVTGNCVVLKPASCAPLTILKIGEYAKEVGFPDGVINIVTGPGSTVGEAIVKHPGVAKINFTGDSAVGKRIMQLASEHVKPVASELGGKNAFVVMNDAPFDGAIEAGVYAAFFNSGQNCGSPSRFYVQEEIYDKYLEKFIEKAKAITVGDTMDPKTMMGPLAYPACRDNAEKAVAKAIADGCVLRLGGERPNTPETKDGAYVMPTVLEATDNSLDIMQEEIFAPVVAFYKFKEDREAIDLVNESRYGLCASVWTTDYRKGMKITDEFDCGTSWINQHLEIVPETPWGGRKESGWTKENSMLVFNEYTWQKHVWMCMDDEPHTFWENFLKD
ncbi:MAG: aldehyde dehydrogenase [Oscillospiraceae bacterium]|nr:aldehyde dehydrogenase [Oscillospiraceae bacterium]